jgi:hypothetical protein
VLQRARAELTALGDRIVPLLFEHLKSLSNESIDPKLSQEERLLADVAVQCMKGAMQDMGEKAVPAIISMLASPVGFYVAGSLPRNCPAAIPPLLSACRSPELAIRRNAILALRSASVSANKRPHDLAPILLELTSDYDGEVRGTAADTLLDISGVRKGLVDRYRLWLQDSAHLVRICGIRALGTLHLDEDLPALIRLLGDKESSIVRCSLEAIGRFGPRAKSAAPAVQAVVDRDKDGCGYCTDAARKTLEKIAGR